MALKSLVDKYLDCKGAQLASGNGGDILLPYLVMVIHNDIYCDFVRNTKIIHEANHYRKEWRKYYAKFEKSLTDCFDNDEMIEFLNIVDEMEKELHNHITICKMAILNSLRGEETEKSEKITNILLCNILTQMAQILWEHVWGGENIHLKEIREDTFMVQRHLYKVQRTIDLNNDDKVADAVYVLCRKVTEYIDKKIKDNG